MPLGTDQITVTTATSFIPELWLMEIIAAAEANLVMAQLVTRFDNWAQGKSFGDTIYIPNLSNLTANNKLANTQVTLQAPTETKTTILLDKHKETSFLVEDITKAQANQDLRTYYTQKAGFAIASQIDTDLLGLYSGLTNSVAAGAAVSYSELIQAMTFLDLADAPEKERYLVIHPTVKADLLDVNEVKDRDFRMPADQAPTQTGLIADVLGCKVYSTNQVVGTDVSAVTTYHNLMFQKGAFGLAIQLGPRVQANYIPQYLGTLVTVDVIYGFAELRDDHAVDIQSI